MEKNTDWLWFWNYIRLSIPTVFEWNVWSRMDVQNILLSQTYHVHWTRLSVIIIIPTRTHPKANNDIIIIRFKTRDRIGHPTFILCHYQTIMETLEPRSLSKNEVCTLRKLGWHFLWYWAYGKELLGQEKNFLHFCHFLILCIYTYILKGHSLSIIFLYLLVSNFWNKSYMY